MSPRATRRIEFVKLNFASADFDRVRFFLKCPGPTIEIFDYRQIELDKDNAPWHRHELFNFSISIFHRSLSSLSETRKVIFKVYFYRI